MVDMWFTIGGFLKASALKSTFWGQGTPSTSEAGCPFSPDPLFPPSTAALKIRMAKQSRVLGQSRKLQTLLLIISLPPTLQARRRANGITTFHFPFSLFETTTLPFPSP